MKHDVNDTLRSEGDDGVRARSDRAERFNGNAEHDVHIDDKPKGRKFNLIPFNEIKLSTALDYVIKGLFPREGLAVVWGAPKCGKSFWAFDAFMHVALGWPYRGRKVQQGPVVYCALEGGSGFARRVEAWRRHHFAEHDGNVPFYLLDVPLDLVREHTGLVAAIRAALGGQKPAAVVIDTLNRALVGDENKSDDMSKFIRSTDMLRSSFNCLVAVIHHCGLQGGRPRGHTSLAGADDVQIAVEKDDAGIVTAKVEHMKDGAADAVVVSRLEIVDLGLDDEGDPITSCIVVPFEGSPVSASTSARLKVTPNQRRFLDILNDAILDVPAEHKTAQNIPGGRIAISREWLKMCCKAKGWFDPKANDNNNRAKVSNMINALAGKRLLGASALYVWGAR